MPLRLHRLLALAVVGVLSVALALPSTALPATALPATAQSAAEPPPVEPPPVEPPPVEPPPVEPPPVEAGPDHSSDENENLLLAPRQAPESDQFFTLHERTRPVAPGLELTRFDRYDSRGWFRVQALTAELGTPGLRMDYAAAGKVSAPGPLSKALRRDRAVAGVNGDFFDIGDTGAPLGVGVDRQRGVLHGSTGGWNKTFVLDRAGVARVVHTFLRASIEPRGRKPIAVSNLNSPTLRKGGIGIYTSAWGADSRTRVLPGAGKRREVVVRAGRVRAERTRLSSGPIPRGTVHLVGTGKGAERLGALRKGQRVRVTYGLSKPARVAVSGNVVLLRDGKVLAPGDAEMHPRTAVGIDRDEGKLILVTVDGRSATSRGLTPRETAVLLKRLGAEDGLNLDGGGSSTMMARESGERIAVVNDPSDGGLRSVPNGLGFAFRKGSGKLRGIRIEPVTDAPDSHRVLRGLTRKLVARGHDETHAPVGSKPRWRGSPRVKAGPVRSKRKVVVGRRPGRGTVTARAAGAVGRFELRVLGPLHRLETSIPSLTLAGKGSRGTVEVRGYDARGFGTWVEPRDLRLDFPRKKLRVRRTSRGLVVTSRVGSTNAVLRISAKGRSTAVGVAVGLSRRVVHRMNSTSGWRASAYPAASDARLRLVRNRHGKARKAVAMSYALRGKRATRAAYLVAKPGRDLPRRARRVGLWVRGDGRGAMLRVRLRDEAGTRATTTLARRVDWKGWRFVATRVPAGLAQPLSLLRVYAVESRPKRRYRGTLAFDDLTVFTERVASAPGNAPLRDPMVADDAPLAAGGLRVAVLSGARLSAATPRSPAVARTRRAMRQIVAARPDLVLVNGDLLRRGRRSDMVFARRLLHDELGSAPWRYLPGDGERAPRGDLSTFRAEFGDPVRVLDRAGTRFVLLNSARGSLRLGGFGQLVRLRNALRTAARDDAVHAVMVVAHHSTSDPAAGGRAELTDPREAAVVEELLADFRAESTKPAGYVGSHARRFATSRHDDVAQVLAGPVSSPARARRGSFSGWSLLRIAPTVDRTLSVEFRPSVDRLRVVAPRTMRRGAKADGSARVVQAGRVVRVDYPMQATWVETPKVHIGPAGKAPASAVLAFAPATGRLTALRPGRAELAVRVNGVRAARTVTVR